MAIFRTCFIGDSITLGTADEELLGWPGRVVRHVWAEGHDVTCYNLGIRADTTTLILKRWRAEAEGRLPPHVQGRLVFAFGVNDSAFENGTQLRVAPEQSFANARAMVGEAKAWKPTLWVGPAPVRKSGQRVNPAQGVVYDFENERIATLDQGYRKIASEVGVPYLPVFDALLDHEPWHTALAAGDGVHPAGVGYAILARLVMQWDAWRTWLN